MVVWHKANTDVTEKPKGNLCPFRNKEPQSSLDLRGAKPWLSQLNTFHKIKGELVNMIQTHFCSNIYANCLFYWGVPLLKLPPLTVLWWNILLSLSYSDMEMFHIKLKSQAAQVTAFSLENSPTDTYHLCPEGRRDDSLIGEVESSRSIL